MVSGDNVTVTLTGGSPWGFRLTGGGSLPLQIAKIRKKSQAHAQGLQEGDAVVSINGLPVHDRSHDEAIDLIDNAGHTLTLQIYRGDADDLGQLLASTKPQGPVLPPNADGETTVTSSSSVTEDGNTRREVQQQVFVTTDAGRESTTFVRREHTVTTSSGGGDVNGNEVGVMGGGGGGLKATVEVSTTAELASAPAPSPSSKVVTRPAVSPKPVSPAPIVASASLQQEVSPGSVQAPAQHHPLPRMDSSNWVPKPTFKALPPKVEAETSPRPSLGPPTTAPKPKFSAKPTFNAKAATGSAGPMFAPQKFQVSATAMYSQQPFSPGGQQPRSSVIQANNQPLSFSPGGKHMSQSSQHSPGSHHPFSPMSATSPLSPASQPFSPISPGSAPMFNVRNNVGDNKNVWQPNMWLPGQEPEEVPRVRQRKAQHHPQPPEENNENVEVPRRMTIKERQQMLLNHTARTSHSLSARQADPDFDAPPEEVQRMSSHKMKIFGPPVEITVMGPHTDLALERMDSLGSEGSSPTSSLHRRKKLYADSAFYEDPTHKYPTIEEQMKLCRLISNSLTSAANKRARGAKMFAKRKRRSTKWVHEAHSEWSSSAGDVANIDDLDSEIDAEEGGSKQLFMFRIPNLKQRVSNPEKNTRMSLKKDEFERLRLQSQKCDHRAVAPDTCFDIVADLKASKGRGGRLFERRKNRADKFIIDESNAKMANPKHTKLDGILGNAPLKSAKSPWEAAQANQSGSVDSAFDHLNNMERMQKMNQILKYQPPKPAKPTREVLQPLNPPPFTGPKTDLRSSSNLPILQGRNFNRSAKGWCSVNADHHHTAPPAASHHLHPGPHQGVAQDYPVESHPRAQSKVQFGDYNPRPRAWQPAHPGGDSFSCPPSMSTSWASSDFDSYHPAHNNHGPPLYPTDELPASDL